MRGCTSLFVRRLLFCSVAQLPACAHTAKMAVLRDEGARGFALLMFGVGVYSGAESCGFGREAGRKMFLWVKLEG